MAPKNQVSAPSNPSRKQPGLFTSVYRELRSPDNAAVVKSVAAFAVAVTFLQTGFGEFLVPSF